MNKFVFYILKGVRRGKDEIAFMDELLVTANDDDEAKRMAGESTGRLAKLYGQQGETYQALQLEKRVVTVIKDYRIYT